MSQLIKCLDNISVILNRFLMGIAGFFLVSMMLITAVNVLFRSIGIPLKGTFELLGYCGAVVAAFALAKTQIERQHIAVDVLLRLFPVKLQHFLRVLSSLIGSVFFILAAWQTLLLGNNLFRVKELSETLGIPYFPFVYAVSAGLLAIAFVLLIDLLKEAKGEKQQ